MPIISGGGGGGGGGSGTVTSVGSANGSVTVTNPTTTPDLAVVFSKGSPTPTAVKTSAYNAVVGDLIPCDISGGSFTVTLPTAPADKSQIVVEVVKRVTTGAPTYVTVACGGSDVLFIAAGATSGIIGRGSVVFQYNASGAIWYAPGTGDLLPTGWEFGYDQITANVSVTSTTESSPTTVITCAAHVFDGGPVMAQFFTNSLVNGGASQTLLNLWEGASNLGILINQSGTSIAPASVGMYRFTPTAGSHSYVVNGWRAVANGTVTAAAGGAATTNDPAFIRFTKV